MKEFNDLVICPACGEKQWVPYTVLPSFIFNDSFEVVSCYQCSLGRTVPEPCVTDSFYQENEKYDILFDDNSVIYRGFASDLLSVLDIVIESKQKLSLIDIGCGGGFLVEEATEKGYLAEGIEANIKVAERGRRRGLKIYTDDIQTLAMSNKYDVVVLSAVLEHVNDPFDLLLKSRDLLVDGGVILISQASYDGLLPKLFPWGWYGWQPEEHYWHFNKKSLQSLAKRSGMKVVTQRRATLYHQWYSTGGLKNIIGRNLATLIGKVGSMLGRGDSFDIVLKK